MQSRRRLKRLVDIAHWLPRHVIDWPRRSRRNFAPQRLRGGAPSQNTNEAAGTVRFLRSSSMQISPRLFVSCVAVT